MRAKDIRRSFVDYFRDRGHAHVPSSSLVPHGDPTLLFTNAGMVQFKGVFQGLEHRDYARAVTAQKCVRAGGKHNDLEQVGLTARHHTFFEMLGNFSFGDYFKQSAIEFAWEWVTSERYLGINPDRILISVHHTDDEARKLWSDVAGISDARIYGLGDKDNFWQMGDTGPCGPCSEMYVDLRPASEWKKPAPTLARFEEIAEEGALFEIWNLVFMQFDQHQNGSRVPLPAPSVDTGAGLERIAAVLQDVPSNYDSDLFMPLIRRAEEIVGKRYSDGPEGVGFRVLADHARAVAFLLAGGVYPSNDGRGYVLRRILRRAVRHAYRMGRGDPTLVELAKVVVDTMGADYPELREKAQHIESVTRAEEERFLETIEGGLKRLDERTSGARGTIAGRDAFKLYDTYGFPVDLTRLIAAERGWTVDEPGFEEELEKQRQRSRTASESIQFTARGEVDRAPAVRRSRGKGEFTRVKPRVRQKFVGYETTKADTEVIAFRQGDEQLELILKENPFYSESGGQVSDTGVVKGNGWTLPVEDVLKVENKQVVVGPYQGDFEPTDVEAVVAEERRHNIERNHSATHLVHAALRNRLGTHVRQAGSVVAPDRLRFDFSHHAPVTPEELDAIEEEVNEGIWANVDVETHSMPYREAIAAGAMAFFGEKYGDVVRVVDVPGISMELCGGTHVRSTGQIGLFHFAGETGVAAGVRRIEAVTGPVAYTLVKSLGERIEEAAGTLRTNPEHVARKIETLLEEKKRLERQVEELLREGGRGKAEAYDRYDVGGTELLVGDSPVTDRGQIGLLMDSFREQHKNAIQVLFVRGDRPGIHVGVTDDLISRGVKAGDLVNRIAEVSGGKGGGRPHFASAGAGDPGRLPEAREQAPTIVSELLGVGRN
jgi:alanyl-tRNA synthetase